MKTIEEIKSALATANKETFKTREVAAIIDIPLKTLQNYIFRHLNLNPKTIGRSYVWTSSDIIRIYKALNPDMLNTADAAAYLGISCDYLRRLIASKAIIPDVKGAGRRPSLFSVETLNTYRDSIHNTAEHKITFPEPITANPESEYASPIDCLIAMNEAAEKDSNFKAYMEMRRLFEAMNESALQHFFAPMLKRFKYSYITENVKSVQSQTLTCINKGKLRGLDKYKLDFNAFLQLLKFCADNNCPTNYRDFQNGNAQEGVNA